VAIGDGRALRGWRTRCEFPERHGERRGNAEKTNAWFTAEARRLFEGASLRLDVSAVISISSAEAEEVKKSASG
jgi:hypothetical protein